MSPGVLLALEVALYSALPFVFALLKPERRLLYFYFYIGLVHMVGGLLGAVFTIPLSESITISAGSVSYCALLFTTLLLVMVANDERAVRNVCALVFVSCVFKFAIFSVTASALASAAYGNPYETSPLVFSGSIRTVAAGGLLIIVELLIALAILGRLSPRISNTALRAVLQVAVFIGCLTLDGVLFPILALAGQAPLGDIIVRGVTTKFIMALGFGIPLLIFLLVFRSRLESYNTASLRLHDVFLAPREELLGKLHEREAALQASQAQLAKTLGSNRRRAAVASALSAVEVSASIEEKLAELGKAVQPGSVHDPGLAIMADDAVMATFGDRAGTFVTSGADRHTLGAKGPWIERRSVGPVVCVPAIENDAMVAVVEFMADRGQEQQLLESVRDLRFEISALLRADIATVTKQWSQRQSIVSILKTGSVTALFQPIVNLQDRSVTSYEGLSRFEPGVSPELRFREAARLGLGTELDLLAARTILSSAIALPRHKMVTVNASPSTIIDSRFADVIAMTERRASIEITEHDQVNDYDELRAALARMPKVSFGVDDTGSGYASLRHILRLAPTYVKLDRTLVSGIDQDTTKQALVRGLTVFLAATGAYVIAEGIEQVTEAHTLSDLGVEFGQGYLFGRPAPAEELALAHSQLS